ncbi:MAG: hypothetical protein A2046_17180 [Bacteroidetes bacterium GWA2_30_7]|nr:MAG: hypothetical protein A2046_17180 [Bacteroidetes bacterium GWA2_30_7]
MNLKPQTPARFASGGSNLKLFLLFFCIFISNNLFSQEDFTTKSKKAIKLFKQAEISYNERKDNEAIEQLKSALKVDSTFIEAYLLKANILHDNRKYEEEIADYKKVIALNPKFSYKTYYFSGIAYLLIGKYNDALENFKTVETFSSVKSITLESNSKLIERCKFALEQIANLVEFNPVNVGKEINTELDEYWPTISVDESKLVFTRLIPSSPNQIISQLGKQEDIYFSYKKDGKWQDAFNAGQPLNTTNNEGAMTLSPDGNIFFYTVCNRPEDYGSCDIYYSRKIGNSWTNPKNLGDKVNSRYWESNPSFSSDGKTLFFISNRTGGFGKMDIWYSKIINKDDNGNFSWSQPQNIGNIINTEESELSPFIHPDNSTFYFASDGHLGMGGQDIFISKKDSLGNWKKPENIGYPINTFKDETGIVVNSKGDYAYIVSDRENGFGGLDIYSFEIKGDIKPVYVNYVKGKIYDAETKKPLSADFELYNIESCELAVSSSSDGTTGEYLVSLPVNHEYAFNASKKGYMFYSEHFSLTQEDVENKEYVLNIPLQPIKENMTVVLKNIFYETDSYTFKKESQAELNKLVSFLKENPEIKIEIGGHTDNVGTKEYNKKLSENRSKTVYDYLVLKEINKDRLTFKGYDFSVPLSTNDTEEGRSLNRRTEFKIVSIK